MVMTRRIVFSVVLGLACWSPRAFGVVFASDEVLLYENGIKITDNTVVMTDSRNPEDKTLVEKGVFFTQQKPGPLAFSFAKLDTAAMTESEWYKQGKGDKAAYLEYLQEQTVLYTVEVTLMEPTDSQTYDPPPPGMTGGTIGSGRRVSVDLITKAVSLIPDDTDQGTPAIEVETHHQHGRTRKLIGVFVLIAVLVAIGIGVVTKTRSER